MPSGDYKRIKSAGHGDVTMDFIGWRFGMSRERVRQILCSALTKLRMHPLMIMQSANYDEDSPECLLRLISACDWYERRVTDPRCSYGK